MGRVVTELTKSLYFKGSLASLAVCPPTGVQRWAPVLCTWLAVCLKVSYWGSYVGQGLSRLPDSVRETGCGTQWGCPGLSQVIPPVFSYILTPQGLIREPPLRFPPSAPQAGPP